MSMQKGKHQGGQTQGYTQRYTTFVPRSTTPQRTEVGFHVTGPGFQPQQGGGGGAPGGPPLRAIHHPHHSGNPSIPPPHQQQPPPQSQGGQGPTPTSTPPGSADMGKQGPSHLQGQPQMPQGQMQINYGVPSQPRPSGSQAYFTGPRGPGAPPRMPHRSVVNMQSNNVSQPIFSQHVPMQQMPQFLAGQVVPTQIHTQQMFVTQSHGPMYAGQPRHQNNVGAPFYPQPGHQPLIMSGHLPSFQQFPSHAAQPGHQFFYTQSPVGMPRAGVPVGGPGLATGANQQVVTGAPHPQQLGQPGQVQLSMVPGSGVVVPGLQGDSGGSGHQGASSSGNKTRRKYAIDIIDPKTMLNIDPFEGDNSNTPPRSGDSSARETPQPNMAPGPTTVAAEFAARVAKVASENSSPPPQTPTPYAEQVVSVNGPDTNSIPADVGQVDTPQVPEEPTSWKPQPSKPISSSNNVSKVNKVDNMKLEVSKEEEPLEGQLVESEVKVVIPVPSLSMKVEVVVPIPTQPEVVPLPTPVVSALTNTPAVEVVHQHRAREHYPALKPPGPVVLPQNPSPVRRKRVEPPVTETPAPEPPRPQPPPQQQKKPSPVPEERKERRDKSRESERAQSRPRDKSSQGKETKSSPVPPPEVQLPPSEEVKHRNGEAPVDTHEGNKPTQRMKQKKVQKINRKGAEKEGTDMDAFVEPYPEEVATVASPAPVTPPPFTPVATSAPPTPIPTPTPTPTPTPVSKPADNQTFKHPERQPEPAEEPQPQPEPEEEVDPEEEKLVAARNEENAKVTAAALKEDVAAVIENVPAKPSAPTLKHNYKDDQWSPMNPDGKKKYERDFLMELQHDPQSQKKPENLPDIEVVLKNNASRQTRMDPRMMMNMNRSQHDTFTPGFVRSGPIRGGPPVKRNSQQGKPKGNKPNVIHVSLSLNADVKLHETENAWKPGRVKPTTASEEEAKTEDLYKKVRGVLNKLTPQKFDTLVSQVQALPIDTSDRLQLVIDLVFEKAVDEPSFSVAYAQMCKVLSKLKVPGNNCKGKEEELDFRKLLVSRCQAEFEKNSEAELNRDEKLKEIQMTTDQEKKKELMLIYEEEERKVRMKSVGNIRFIGELFKLQMLATNIMIRCIKHLLGEKDEESLECLCKLLTTIGKDLEGKAQDLQPYFNMMRDISNRRGEVSSRVRFMLQDVIELRANKWIPRRDDSNPKTMDQIQKDAEKESMDMQMALNSAPPTPRRQDDRGGTVDRRKARGGNITNEQGWNTVTANNRSSSRYTVDTSKLKSNKDSMDSFMLGSRKQFTSWGRGASVQSNEADKKGSPVTYSNSNIYNALDMASEERPTAVPTTPSSRPTQGKPGPEKPVRSEMEVRPIRGQPQQQSRSSSRDSSARRSEDMEEPHKPQPPAQPDFLTGLQLEKATHSMLDEFLNIINFQEAERTVVETFVDANLTAFVLECMNFVLERTSCGRKNVGLLMSHLIKAKVLKKTLYLNGLMEFLGFADDLAIDVPKFWLYLAESIVPLLSAETLTLEEFREIARISDSSKMVPEVLKLLVKDKGPGWIREKWDLASLQWTDFLEPDRIDSFVKEHELEFMMSGASSSSAQPGSSLSIEQVEEKLEQFLKPPTPSTFDQICDWITANVGPRVAEPQFIRALMTAVCRSAIQMSKTTWKMNEKALQQQQKLVLKYVDNQEHLELQCLFAVQMLMNQLEHPQGILCQIFQTLWDDSIISTDSFIAWETSTDPLEQAGKGVALKSLTTFFTALREPDDDSSYEDS